MNSPVLEAIRLVFSSSASRETKELVAKEYRELRGCMVRHPEYAELDRQIEEIFTAHGIPPLAESESPKS